MISDDLPDTDTLMLACIYSHKGLVLKSGLPSAFSYHNGFWRVVWICTHRMTRSRVMTTQFRKCGVKTTFLKSWQRPRRAQNPALVFVNKKTRAQKRRVFDIRHQDVENLGVQVLVHQAKLPFCSQRQGCQKQGNLSSENTPRVLIRRFFLSKCFCVWIMKKPVFGGLFQYVCLKHYGRVSVDRYLTQKPGIKRVFLVDTNYPSMHFIPELLTLEVSIFLHWAGLTFYFSSTFFSSMYPYHLKC